MHQRGRRESSLRVLAQVRTVVPGNHARGCLGAWVQIKPQRVLAQGRVLNVNACSGSISVRAGLAHPNERLTYARYSLDFISNDPRAPNVEVEKPETAHRRVSKVRRPKSCGNSVAKCWLGTPVMGGSPKAVAAHACLFTWTYGLSSTRCGTIFRITNALLYL